MGQPFELATDRLTIRMLRRSDITEFTHYRNLPGVARFQDWPLPYTRDLAHLLVDDQENASAPARGTWTQLALERDRQLIGDLAVWLDDPGSLAMIGYTLAPGHQGKGYATEAAGALVDYLFRRRRVHRVAATLDPRNLASARVLERCGFRYIGTARSAALVRDEWCDDTRYELLRENWDDWRGRPTGRVRSVEFVEVTAENLHDVCAIEAAPTQRRFVSPVTKSIADAAHAGLHEGEPVVPWYRAVRADGDLAAFVMLASPTEKHPVPYLWRFLVDHRHQGRGVGRKALGVLGEFLQAEGYDELELSFVDEPGGPERFYVTMGFTRTGETDHESGEVMMRATLHEMTARAQA